MSNVLIKLINEMKNEPGSIAKIEILTNYKNKLTDEDFEIIKLVYSNTYNFGISGSYLRKNYIEGDNTINISILSLLQKAYNREVVGNDLFDLVSSLLNNKDKDYQELIFSIFDRNLKFGCNIKSINKAFGKNFIKTTPYMGAVSYSEKKAKKLFENGNSVELNTKMDGRYANIIVNNNEVEIFSRSGKQSYFNGFNFYKEAVEIAYNLPFDNVVLNGELLVKGFDRYKANGIINAISQIREKELNGINTEKDKEKFKKSNSISITEAEKRITATIWDFVPLENYRSGEEFKLIREERRNLLETAVADTKNISFINYKIVNNFEEAMTEFKKLLAAGEEGAILKSNSGLWKDGKPVYQIKMKLELTVDLKIIGFNEGNKGTKYEGSLGSFICESEDGLLKSDPGGIKEDLRDEIWNNKEKYIGKIIEVKSCGLSHDVDMNYSLLHPSFNEIRTDKNVADTLQQIKENQNMVLGLS